jgi:hypothetical protein
MAKYEHSYILHTPPCKPPSPHLAFGVMAHDCLYKAGKLRDESTDGVLQNGEYQTVIPSEVLYDDLKKEFNITNWQAYFTPIIKQTAKYEQDLLQELLDTHTGSVTIEREIKLQLTVDQLENCGYFGIKQPVVGIIDCLMYTKTHAIILDYKFSSSKKTQDDFDMNSQLPLYALFVHILYDIPLHNIQYGYIDIPKQMFGIPTVLSNGTLSRSKSQNVSQEFYEKCVIEIHGDDEYYNCKEGGYYHECWCHLALNKPAYLSIQYLDFDVCAGITEDLMNAAKMIDFMIDNKLPFLKKYDAYSCKGCEYLNSCKPWLVVNNKGE